MKVPCEGVHLDVDEGGELELVSGPLTQEELVTLLLRQSVEELREEETTERERGVTMVITQIKGDMRCTSRLADWTRQKKSAS